MARKPPTPSTVKKLFGFSNNNCASPVCNNNLIEDDVVIGEICHIEAAEDNGPRFNKDSNDEYRRSFDNLLILCPSCHKKIDSDISKYKTPLVTEWKKEHESKIKTPFAISEKVVNKSIEKFMNQKNENYGSGTQFSNQADTQNIGAQIGTQTINFNTISNKKRINIDGARPFNDDLKGVIEAHKIQANPPAEDVIDYQNELKERIPRPIYLVETKFLKFRKDNGRIMSDVLSHQKIHNIELDEKSEAIQKLLREFLQNSDVEKKIALKQQLRHKSQQRPAIITCDGFLINGNRRKMAFEELFEENDQDPKFEKMRVVILPDNVTEKDIRKIENRYQLQDEGKSEYQGINRALVIRENINVGYNLRAQLRDDPKYTDKEKKEFDRIVKEYEKEYLNPLECAEKYIQHFNKTDIYKSVSESTGDREGRWQAFKDYSSFYFGTLKNPAARIKNYILESDVGKIEDLAFKIIRKRDLRGLSKLHMFMRPPNMKRFLSNDESKKIVFEIVDNVDNDITEEEKVDKEGVRISESDIDKKWGKKYEEIIIGSLMKAKRLIENQNERDKPIDLLEDALKKLNHDNLKIDNLGIEHYNKALTLTLKISNKALEIYEEVDHARGNLKKLKNKGKS
ncbi:MAG: hypothetical protein ACJAT9_000355 [Polaribacter sp.]|jgi:hypothetical protein